MKNKYYVYVYLRKDRYTPYYVGKGEGRRCYRKHRVSVPSRDRIVILKENLSEEESYELEKLLILFWGRKDIGTGVLLNLTEGGEGGSGVPYERTQETREKVSQSLLEHYKRNPKPKREKVKLTREEKTKLVSSYMNKHWNSPEGEKQKELYRERNRVRIQEIVDSVEVPPPTGNKQILFYGKVFSSQRECNKLTGVSRTYISKTCTLL